MSKTSSTKKQRKIDVPEGCRLIFRRFRKSKNGEMLDARRYGIKAWPIVVCGPEESPA